MTNQLPAAVPILAVLPEARVSPIDLVSAVRIAAEHAADLRDGPFPLEGPEEAFVGSEPGRTSSGAADPIVVPHERSVVLHLDLEAAVIELPGIGVRAELQQDGEREDPREESLDRGVVRRFVSEHAANRLVGPVPEPCLDPVERFERDSERIPAIRRECGPTEAGT